MGIVIQQQSTGKLESGYSSNDLYAGVDIFRCDVYVKNISAKYNQAGIRINNPISTVITNSTFISNNGSGIELVYGTNATIVHVSSKYTIECGIIASASQDTTITDFDIANNSGCDITLLSGTDFKLVRTVAFLMAHNSNI